MHLTGTKSSRKILLLLKHKSVKFVKALKLCFMFMRSVIFKQVHDKTTKIAQWNPQIPIFKGLKSDMPKI